MSHLHRFLSRFSGDRRGSLLAEVGVTLSLLVTLTLSGVEIAHYALLHQKMERVAASIGDLVAQAETLTEADITNIFAAAEYVAKPFDIPANGRVIVSSIGVSGGTPPQMYWQRTGGGTYVASSQIGTPGSGPFNLPAGFAIVSGDSVIVAEVIFRYTPWIAPGVVSATEIYHNAFFRPRFGMLNQVN